MLSDQEFLNKVWDKYHDSEQVVVKDNFYKTDYYTKHDLMILIKSIIRTIIVLFSSVSVVYASTVAYEYIQKRATTHYEQDMNSYFEISDKEIYYKSIDNYNEYKQYKNKWENIKDIKETDFENNFVLVLIATWRMPEITIENLKTDENTLYVYVSRNISEDAISKKEYMVSSIIPLEYYRKNIKIEMYDIGMKADKYVPLEELPSDYSLDDARKDNCVVLENNMLDENSKILWKNFENAIKENNDAYIRIVVKTDFTNENDISIRDVEFINGEYLSRIDETRVEKGSKSIGYLGNFTKIDEHEITGGYTIVQLTNSLNESVPLLIYK